MATKITIQQKNSLGNSVNEQFKSFDTFANPDVNTAQIIDNFARGINALTTNTYQDTIITSTKSITEILAE